MDKVTVTAKQLSFSQAEYKFKKKLTRRDIFLAMMSDIVPWGQLIAIIAPHYPRHGKRGRPPIGIDRMLRMYFIQQWYGLADVAVEDAIYDSLVLRNFCSIDLSIESVPDATTLMNFRHLLETHELPQSMLKEINALLRERGLLMNQGTLIDATLIAAPSSTKNKNMNVIQRCIRPRKTIKDLALKHEKLKACVRAKVEHPFHTIKNIFKHKKTRYKGLQKNHNMLFSLSNLYMMREKLRP